MPGQKQFFQKHYVPLRNNYELVYDQTTGNDAFLTDTGSGARANKDEDPRNLIKMTQMKKKMQISFELPL